MRTVTIIGFTLSLMLIGCSDTPPETSEVSTSNEPAPTEEWFFLAQETRIGPMSEAELRAAAARGHFRAEDQVWSQELGNWASLSSALPGIEIGGTEEAGTAWAGVFRKAELVPEPLIPGNRRSNELTENEINTYLVKGKRMLDEMHGLIGQYGPEPVLNARNPIGRLAKGRQLARMLRHDLRREVKRGDRDRAMLDMAALCSVAHQLSISRAWGDNRTETNPAAEYFEYSKMTSISVIRMVADIILDPAHARWSQEFRSTAEEHLDWVDSDLRASFNPNPNARRTPAQEASLNLTRELMGF